MCNMKQENKDLDYEKIFGNNRKQMKRVYNQFKMNYEKLIDLINPEYFI